jgi:hypothetical protein
LLSDTNVEVVVAVAALMAVAVAGVAMVAAVPATAAVVVAAAAATAVLKGSSKAAVSAASHSLDLVSGKYPSMRPQNPAKSCPPF